MGEDRHLAVREGCRGDIIPFYRIKCIGIRNHRKTFYFGRWAGILVISESTALSRKAQLHNTDKKEKTAINDETRQTHSHLSIGSRRSSSGDKPEVIKLSNYS
jgi:hypothetical protein